MESASRKLAAFLVFLGAILAVGNGQQELTEANQALGNASDASSGPLLSLQRGGAAYHKAIPIVEPDSTHTKLVVSNEGLSALSHIKTDGGVAVVAVIGPYRSGKSFLLNQLLSLPCSEGFGVGHQRETKTKGIWIWGEPLLVKGPEGRTTSVLFMDTEGFESIGKSDVYDDRIFALSAILSSVLIYNLPETVKETDISKLSFATELGEEFYGRVAGRESPFQPAKLLWLIQRDFLEGKTVQAMVQDALKPVPNPRSDPEVDHMNAVRHSLNLMGSNSSAFGLRQPHLERTKLCELKDQDLDQSYIRQREELKAFVADLVAPKTLQGRHVNGQEFAQLLQQVLEALNNGDFPSTASVVESFNRAIMDKCLLGYKQAMLHIKLPVHDGELQAEHEKQRQIALQHFENDRFGRRHGQGAVAGLEHELRGALEGILNSNSLKSSQLCQETYAGCEDRLDGLQVMRLPSTGKFEHGFAACNKTYLDLCLGPSRDFYAERLQKMWQREQAKFLQDYNRRLFNWLVVLSLCVVALARFCLKSFILEMMAWLLFAFLEVYTRVFFSSDLLYHNTIWKNLVWCWELVIYNPVIDLDAWLVPIAFLSASWCIHRKWSRRQRKRVESLLPISLNQVKVAVADGRRRSSKDSPLASQSPTSLWSWLPRGATQRKQA